MKKIWLALAGMVLAFSASAAQFEDGKQYTTIWKSPLPVNRRCWSSSHSIAHTATSLKKSFMFLRM